MAEVLQVNCREGEENLNLMKENAALEASRVEEELNTTKKDAETKIHELEVFTSNLEKNAASKDADLNDAYSKNNEMLQEIADLKESLEKMKEELSLKNEELSNLTESFQAKVNIEAKVESESLQRSDATSESVPLKEQILNLETELNKRQLLVSDLVSDCMRLKNELSTINSEKEKEKEDRASLLSQTQSLFALKAQYEANENHLKSELAEKDRVIHKQQETVEEMKNEAQALLQKFGAPSLFDIHVMHSAHLKDINNLNVELQEKTENVEELTSQIQALKDDHDAVKSEMVQLQENTEEMARKLAMQEEEYSNLMRRCASAEQGYAVLEEELNESRKRWEGEKTGFIMKLDEEEVKTREAVSSSENYKQRIMQVENTLKELQDQLDQKESDIERLQDAMALNQVEMEQSDKNTKQIHNKLLVLGNEFRKDNSVFQTILNESRSNVVEEAYQQSSDDTSENSSVSFLESSLKRLESALNDRLSSNESSERIRLAEERLIASEARLQAQAQQLHQALSDREQLHSQMSVTTNALHQYQAQYNNLHAEYMRVRDQLSQNNKVAEQSPVPKVEPDDEVHSRYKRLVERFEEVSSEKDSLSERLLQVEDQLRAEMEHCREIESQWQEEVRSLCEGKSGRSTTINMGSSDDEPILLKPSTFTRQVTRSRNICSQFIRARSLSRSHLRPFSSRTLIILYFIFIHAFTVKCALGL